MWLFNSSVGKKVLMSVTGLALVFFLLFHMSMNLVAIFSTEGYNMICEFLGANWYALAGTAGLAVLVVVHFVYAFILTMQNRRARGSQRYAVSERCRVGITEHARSRYHRCSRSWVAPLQFLGKDAVA